ncbi:hypothetical protein T459_23812 [Capsicum annuum]|uniref:Uncharacterized protein n=1 Tax=Capsicum annuum TaxID=4072 RepID=A0A2G2YTD0_CAPAN|nr:hypothetical protein T459_23812 [Capsicum annuum]
MHISMMILGYAALLCGLLLSVALLVITFQKNRKLFCKSNGFLNDSFFLGENVLENNSFFFCKKLLQVPIDPIIGLLELSGY